MIRAGNELMKVVRESLGLSQAQMAERLHMTQRTISRIETGNRDLGVWEYFSLMEMAGNPTEDLLPLLLDSGELKDYYTFKKIKELIGKYMFAEIRDILSEFEKDLSSKQPFIIQYVAYAKIHTDEEMPHEQAIKELYEVLRMSVKNFEECNISKYRFTYNEINIIFAIAVRMEALGRLDCAMSLYKSVIESRGNAFATDEDKSRIFPAYMYNLSRLLGRSGMHKESLSYSRDAYGLCKKYSNFRLVPNLLFNMAHSYYYLGEEKQIYQTYLIRAYHTAHALGNTEIVNLSKKNAEKFGIPDLEFTNHGD